jgi:hypothetical protein
LELVCSTQVLGYWDNDNYNSKSKRKRKKMGIYISRHISWKKEIGEQTFLFYPWGFHKIKSYEHLVRWPTNLIVVTMDPKEKKKKKTILPMCHGQLMID